MDLTQLPKILGKGTVLSVAVLEQITEVSSRIDPEAFRLACLSLRSKLETLLRQRGIVVSIRSIHGELHILDDPSMAVYETRAGQRSRRRILRAGRKLDAVDLSKLSNDELNEWEKAQQQAAVDALHFRKRNYGQSRPW